MTAIAGSTVALLESTSIGCKPSEISIWSNRPFFAM